MVIFLCTPSCSRIALTFAMETMHFFIVQLSLSLRTKILCISGVPMKDLAPMKNCPGGCKVGQISSRGITPTLGQMPAAVPANYWCWMGKLILHCLSHVLRLLWVKYHGTQQTTGAGWVS